MSRSQRTASARTAGAPPWARVLALLLTLPMPLAGCRVAPPTPEAWLTVGFRSPEQTFATFCTAVAADQPDLEYRCLGAYFKESNQLNQLSYREFRAELERRWPWVREIASAELIESGPLEEGVWRIAARVKFLWRIQEFEVLLQREDFFELYAGRELLLDGGFDFETNLSAEPGSEQVDLFVPTQAPIPSSVDGQAVSELRVGREWKIAGLRTLDPETD